jgi:hypothetical protein
MKENQSPHASVPFSYKPNLDETVDRHRRFWTRQMPNEVLAGIRYVDELTFIPPDEQCPDLDAMFNSWDANYLTRRTIIDDIMPVARVSFGSAAFGGFLGADVSFEYGIGWAHPFLESYDQLDELRYDPDNPWIQRQRTACRYFVNHAAGKFMLCETETIDGLNLVEGLRGSRAYTDIYDDPEAVHRLLEFSSDFNIRILDMQREILAPNLYYQDGIFSMFRNWLPGRAPWMSVDAYGNCSPKVFREFGSPYLQRMIDYYDGGWMHIHSHALHNLGEIVKLDKLTGIGVADDPNVPGGFEELENIRAITVDIPLQIDCSAHQLQKGMQDRTLPGNVMYMVKQGIETVDQANRLMDEVRAYRSVL